MQDAGHQTRQIIDEGGGHDLFRAFRGARLSVAPAQINRKNEFCQGSATAAVLGNLSYECNKLDQRLLST
jgi:hypothetical protein